MNEKKQSGKKRLFLLVLAAFGIVLWITFTNLNRIALRHTLDETIGFVKIRLEQYETDAANDRVKSLVRLLDKTVSLGNEMTLKEGFGTQDLDAFAEEQRLTGALVLDENLNVVMQTTKGGDAMPLWEKLIDSAYVRNIVEYPKKTYSTRLEENGIRYDFAAAARADAPGILITYMQKDNEDIGDLTVDSLLRNFPLELSGIATITENGRVISSNSSEQIDKTTEECLELYNGTYGAAEDGIVRLTSNQGVWYGSKEYTGNYTLFVFFPASQVFMTRNIVCASYLAIAVMVFLMALLWQTKMEKDALRQHQKRTGIITALGTAYTSISLVDLKKNTVEIVKSASDTLEKQKHFALKRFVQQEQIDKIIAEPYREEYLAFADMTTVAERLKGHTSLALAAQTVDKKWILTLITPQRKDADGNVTAVLVATRDATEEKRREQKQEDALRDALAAAEHANKAKTVFLNSMSHDIRTPMNAIIGFTALATAHIDNIDLVKEYLQKISVSGQHLLSLINDILDMSRIESGTVKLDNAEVHLPDVLHDLRTIIQGNISAKQLDLYIDTQDVHHEDIITDKLRLNQVLLNIVGNAVKFTPAGGTINIRVEEKPSARSGYTTFVFSVKDNGIGMSKDFQAHVFDSFTREQTATRSGIQGTGLGMAISKNIVDMMGGTIAVKSEQGKGSEFTVTLDCKVCAESVKYQPIPGLKGTRALVVDDDAQTCMSVSKMLREIEMEADWTTSGKEAILRAMEAHNQGADFKVYIIDWLMPDMNGIETVRRIRKVIEPGTPIIILTAYDWADIEDEARQAGVTAFVSKPLFMSELRDALTRKEVSGRQPLLPKHGDYTGKKVLLVEDNELNREIATAILEEAGLKVDAVEDGTDAVARMTEAAEDAYDLILMDIQMPKMDGYTATREIRTLRSNKKANIPIVAMTANAFEEDRQKALKAGMNAHIAKPIDVSILMRTLDKIFKQNP